MKFSCHILCAALILPISSLAQEKLAPAARILYDDYLLEVHSVNHGSNPETMRSAPMSTIMDALVTVDCASTVENIREAGFDVEFEVGNIVGLKLPLDKIDKLNDIKGVVRISFGETLRPMLDIARPACGVSEVQSGLDINGTNTMYNGAGIVVGMMDTGLEGNHINFMGPDGKTSRVKRIFHMQGSASASTEYTERNLSRFTTDNTSESHATHVAGILGGSYNGPGTYLTCTATGANKTLVSDGGNIPYYGVATGSDLAFAVGSLSNYNIINGVKNIINYATSQNQPVVVNLSLGSNYGPHDGTSDIASALGVLGKDAIICIAAGNEGSDNIALNKTFTATSNILKTSFNTIDYVSGIADIWGDDSTPLSVTWSVYNPATMGYTTVFSANSANQSLSSVGNESFTKYFSGSVKMVTQVDPVNKRYHAYCTLSNILPTTAGADCFLVLDIEGEAGHKVWVYGNKVAFMSNNIKGASNGSPDGSISDIACAPNSIAVGSFTSRTKWPQFGNADDSGLIYQYTDPKFQVDAISPFSSYGTTFQGENLPIVCAPGAAIISSYSSYYVKEKGNSLSMTARVNSGAKTYYWGQMQGTSMACPYVTGTVGLWLQANPNLKIDDVKSILENTSVTQRVTGAAKKQWGYGRLDAVAGIKKAIEMNSAGIDKVIADDDSDITLNVIGYRTFEILNPSATNMNVAMYNMQGGLVQSANSDDSSVTIDASGLVEGIYILKVETPASRPVVKRVVVK